MRINDNNRDSILNFLETENNGKPEIKTENIQILFSFKCGCTLTEDNFTKGANKENLFPCKKHRFERLQFNKNNSKSNNNEK